MGEIARTDRAQRFIDEFTADIVPECPGDEKFTPTRIYLGLREHTQEVVCVYVFVSDKGHELVLEDGIALFDPEYHDMEDVISDMEGRGIPDAAAKAYRVFAMTPEEKMQRWLLAHPGHWEDHPKYPVDDWQFEVANGDTRHGYRDWLCSKVQEEEPADDAPNRDQA